MTLLRPSGSFQRYFLDGAAPRPEEDAFFERLRDNRFKTIENAADEIDSIGWVTAHHPFDTEFIAEKIYFPPYVLIALRRDRKRVPRNLVKAYLAAEIAANPEEGPPSRARRRELEQAIQSRLTERQLPTLQTHTVLWNTKRHLLLFFSTSVAANDALNSLFRLTFGVGLIPALPFLLADRLNVSRALRQRLSEISPSRIVAAREEVLEDEEPLPLAEADAAQGGAFAS